MDKTIEKYSDIIDEDCTLYTGEQLKNMYFRSTGFHQMSFESIKNGKREKTIYYPHDKFENMKMYKCFIYSRISGAGIEYQTVAILNY